MVTINNDGKEYPIENEVEIQKKSNWEPHLVGFRRFGGKEDLKPKRNLDPKEDVREWELVERLFHNSVAMVDKKTKSINQIVRITKLRHEENRKLWEDTKESIIKDHSNNPLRDKLNYTQLLWHGSGSLDPNIIFETKQNWNPQFASAGLWGKGCYFASDAAYSANYAYTTPQGNKVILLAEVIIGQGIQCLENRNIIVTPSEYNSVFGHRHDTWIYVVYGAGMGYPHYEVEWKPV